MDSPVSRAPPPKNSPAQGRSHVSLTPRQQHQLADLFTIEEHAALEVTWSIYQNIVDACRTPDTSVGKAMMRAEINTRTSTRVPSCPTELMTLGRTLKRRARDILAYFDHPHTPQAAPPKPSTDASNTYAAPHSGSGTSPTTLPEHSSKQEDSDHNYTPNYKRCICAPLPQQRDLQQFAVGASIAPMCILNAPRFYTTYASPPPMQAAADDTPHHKHADKPPFSALFQ